MGEQESPRYDIDTAPETSYGVDEHGNPPSNTKAHGEHQGTLGTRCTRFFYLATRFFLSNTVGTRVNPGQPGQLDPGPEPVNLMVLQVSMQTVHAATMAGSLAAL